MQAHLHTLQDRQGQLLLSHFQPVWFDIKCGLSYSAGDACNVGHWLPVHRENLFKEDLVMCLSEVLPHREVAFWKGDRLNLDLLCRWRPDCGQVILTGSERL